MRIVCVLSAHDAARWPTLLALALPGHQIVTTGELTAPPQPSEIIVVLGQSPGDSVADFSARIIYVDVAAAGARSGETTSAMVDDERERFIATSVRIALAPVLSKHLPLAMVAAMARNRVIGNAGQLPWHEPADLAHFKRTTTGHAVIMGRKTWDSLGRPLPRRRNLVVTRQPGFIANGAEVFADLTQAIAAARATDGEPMIIGGGEIYALALPFATRIELTEIACEPPGDAYFPALGSEWIVADSRTSGACTFCTWIRT